MNKADIITPEKIHTLIYTLRGVQVMLDKDIAELYGVRTKVLNQAVKRNRERFPEEFMFQLDDKEIEILRSQFVTSRWGGRRYIPYVFTEQGVAMLSAVIKSKTAVSVSIQIMNAFVSMRRFLLANAQIFQRLDTLELKQIKIIDESELYHFGASLKELGRKWFAFTNMNLETIGILENLKEAKLL